MNRKTIKDIVGSNLCTGCGACTTVCCKSCISIEKTNIGRLYAKINDNLCIKCGQCFRVCPNFNEKLPYNQSDLFLGTVIDTYIGKSFCLCCRKERTIARFSRKLLYTSRCVVNLEYYFDI